MKVTQERKSYRDGSVVFRNCETEACLTVRPVDGDVLFDIIGPMWLSPDMAEVLIKDLRRQAKAALEWRLENG